MIDLMQTYSCLHKIFFHAWKLQQWLRMTPTRFSFLAKHTRTQECRVFLIMKSPCFSPRIFRQLSKISDSNLLLPHRFFSLRNMAIFQFEPAKTLKELVQEQELSIRQIFQLGLDIAKALDTLHQSGHVHLDVSPDNIYVSKDQRFLLGDFSNCRKFNITVKHLPEYTKGYSAPECYQNQYSYLSDQYSLSALLYALCNDGQPPSQNHSDRSDCQLVQLHPELSEWINPFFETSLSQNPDARFPDFSSYQQDLQGIIEHLPGSPLYSFHIPSKSHPFLQTQTSPINNRNFSHTSQRKADAAQRWKRINNRNSSHTSQRSKQIYYLFPFLLFVAIILLLCKQTFFRAGIATSQPTPSPRCTSSPTPSPLSSPTATVHARAELDISHSKISSLTEVINETTPLNQITVLYGEHNMLQNVEELSAFSSLEELYLSNNKITDTRDFRSLCRLKILILSDNNCTDLSGLASLKKLTFLDLSGNSHLSRPEILFSLSGLKTLVLTDTNLSRTFITQLQNKLPDCQIIF